MKFEKLLQLINETGLMRYKRLMRSKEIPLPHKARIANDFGKRQGKRVANLEALPTQGTVPPQITPIGQSVSNRNMTSSEGIAAQFNKDKFAKVEPEDVPARDYQWSPSTDQAFTGNPVLNTDVVSGFISGRKYQRAKIKKMNPIEENFSFNPADSNRLVDGSYNISKIEDPIELKRLNNYISTVISSNVFETTSRKSTMIQLRLKLNLLGYDIDLPKGMSETGPFNQTIPLKRFGGIVGIDDMGQKLDNPYGPGPKMDITFSTDFDILSAKISPSSSTPVAAAPVAPVSTFPKAN